MDLADPHPSWSDARILRLLVITTVIAPSLACYRFTGAELEQVVPGQKVRAQLSATGLDDLRTTVGTDGYGVRAGAVSGEVVRADAASIVLLVPWVPGAGTAAMPTLNQRVSLPRQAIVQLQTRTLDRGKTAGLIGAVALASAALLIKVFSGVVGSSAGAPGAGAPAESGVGLVGGLP